LESNEQEAGEFGTTFTPTGSKAATHEEIKFTPALVCYAGPERGQTFFITKLETIVGRGAELGICVSDEQASRRHLRILYKNWMEASSRPQCFLEDLGSRNGTLLNGQLLHGKVQLAEHDRIQIGNTVFGYVAKDEQEVHLDNSLREHATIDSLTRLNNRRQFETQLALQLEETRATGRPGSLLIIDADRFKLVNDTHGHDAGDAVLVHLANVIRDCCRKRETCARWGGEEFVVLLPNCDRQGAESAAERIRTAVQAEPAVIGQISLKITVSIGGTTFTQEDCHESLFRRADQELLKAKSGGRNRAYIA